MAAKVFSDAGGNWSDNAAWVGGSPAVNGDTVTATGTSGNITIDVASACTSIILTNYVGILTFNAALTVGGTVTFVSGMGTIAGSSDLICTTTATLTSGGKVLSGGLQLGGTSQTFTLGDNWSVTGVLNFNGTTGTVLTGTAKIITVAGGLTVGVNVTTATTPGIIMTGGSWTGAGILRINLTFQGGTITLLNGSNYFDTKTLTYTSGTIVVTGNTLQCAASTTFVGNDLHWNNVTVTGGGASFSILIPAIFYVDGTLTCAMTGNHTFSNNYYAMIVGALTISGSGGTLNFPGNVTVTGALTVTVVGTLTLQTIQAGYNGTAASFLITGAATILAGYGTWTIAGTTTITANVTFNVGLGSPTWSTAGFIHGAYNVGGTATIILTGGTWSGTGTWAPGVTLSGTITIDAGTRYCGSLSYTTGVITLAGVNLSCAQASPIFNTDPLVWDSLILTYTASAVTVTINSLLSISGTFTLANVATTFAGTAGFTVGTLTNTTITATRIITFANDKTYTITAAFTTVHAAAQTVRFTFTSDHASIKAIIILGPGTTQSVGFVDPIRIDSSAGQQIFSFKGVITTCLNWISAYPVNTALNDSQFHIGI